MDSQSKKNILSIAPYVNMSGISGDAYGTKPLPRSDIDVVFEKIEALNELLRKIESPMEKKCFLVFKHNKYVTVSTENIAFFYVRHESTIIVCLDRQEFLVNHSLEQVQNLVSGNKFFRVNRQYLVNFSAVKEVEHYFARKLLVNLFTPAPEKLLVPKEKSTEFLHWLENR